MENNKRTFLGTEKISRLMAKFAIPSIIGMLVSALYNIIDQLFIGQKVGIDGNAATNIAFPLTTLCIACALLFGIGGASCFNLSLGKGDEKRAAYFAGCSASMQIVVGAVLFIATEIFLYPILHLCGAQGGIVEEYAASYVRITAIGFPFLILTTGGGNLMRADGSPSMTMLCNIIGAVINIILDSLFVLVFDWGMAGAAWATVIGQLISAIIVLTYFKRFKTVKLNMKHFIPRLKYLQQIVLIGMAAFFNQIAIMAVNVVLNQLLRTYGNESIYGATVTIASAGIVMKVFQVFFSFIIGLSQGSQPIESYNYGARKYDRVRGALLFTLGIGGILSVAAAVIFQVFPAEILTLFGKGDAAYMEFGVRFFRIFLLAVVVDFFQPIVSTFFTSIGKAYKGVFLSLTRQFLFFIPLLLILSRIFGLDGILYAGPAADLSAFAVTIIMMTIELRNIRKLERETQTVYA